MDGNGTWIVYEVKGDGSKDKWITTDTEEQARAWAENYNVNQRPTRQRKFIIEPG